MENIKEKLTSQIEQKIEEFFKSISIPAEIAATPKFVTARSLAESIVVLIADFVKAAQPGPTGEFPQGKLNPTDEGELKMAISHDEKLVRIDFGKPTAWFAMPKSQALTFAFAVLDHCGVQIAMQELPKGDAV